MSIRDEEIKRLIKYSEGLNLPVKWVERTPYSDDPGAMVISHDGVPECLEMYVWPGKSKTQIILDFLHELGHQLGWIYNNRTDPPELLEACSTDNPDKKQRKLIYEMEKRDAVYRDYVYNEVGIKIPHWKLDVDIALDLWYYKYWWRTNKHPTKQQFKRKEKELKILNYEKTR